MADWFKAVGCVILAVIGVFLFMGFGAAISAVGAILGFIVLATTGLIFLVTVIRQWLHYLKTK